MAVTNAAAGWEGNVGKWKSAGFQVIYFIFNAIKIGARVRPRCERVVRKGARRLSREKFGKSR